LHAPRPSIGVAGEHRGPIAVCLNFGNETCFISEGNNQTEDRREPCLGCVGLGRCP